MTQAAVHARRRGLATFVAVCMLLLTAVALAALSTALASEHRRTREAQVGAQLRMLLLAGEAHVLQPDAEPLNAPRELGAPVPNATLRIEHVPGAPAGRQHVRVTATLDRATLTQLITVVGSNGRTRIVDRRLDRLH